MSTFFYWLGVIHAAAYAVLGFGFAAIIGFEFGFNALVKRLGIGRDLIRMYARYLKEKHAGSTSEKVLP